MNHYPREMSLDADGVRLHYLDWGNEGAQPMILLHGLQDCARSWDFFAENMRSEFHVIALDSRGHGDSAWLDPSRYGFEDYVADVESLIDHLHLENTVLIGHSAGGRYAFVYAERHPDKVASLVVVDIDPDAVNLDSRQMFERYQREGDEWESLEEVIERLRSRQPNSSEEMLEHQAIHMTKQTPEGKRVWKRDRAILSSYERPDLWENWSRVTCPTLIVRGRQSNLLTHEVAVKMSEVIPKSRLAELDGGGHWFYQEFPGAFETTFRWFLQSPPE